MDRQQSTEWSARHSTLVRRAFLARSAGGLGAMALATLAGGESRGQSGVLEGTHFAPRAKRVIFLFMAGAPSQMDLFDYKPHMKELHGTELPPSVRMGQRLTTMTSGQQSFPLVSSPYRFAQHGQSGAEVSELLPCTAQVVDELCFVKSMHTDPINHDPAVTFIQTGNQLPGRPSIGSWLSYGLGTENSDLPAFVVMVTGETFGQPVLSRYWHSGFLPGRHQGVQLRTDGDAVLYLSNPAGVTRRDRGRMVDAINELNRLKLAKQGDPEIETRIKSFEMAFRMQASVPELMDLGQETQASLDLYGAEPGKRTFANSCLLARRLAERGVRFIQIFHKDWDHHNEMPKKLPILTRETDRGAAALIADLKQRGMLDDTLVVWGGEFGRTIYCQGDLKPGSFGRDHHPRCFTYWLAGGGVKAGLTHGKTDDFSYNVIEKPVHARDLHATIMCCLGIDHTRLTHPFQGLDARLTGVDPARIVREILAHQPPRHLFT